MAEKNEKFEVDFNAIKNGRGSKANVGAQQVFGDAVPETEEVTIAEDIFEDSSEKE